jgi:hypothetical protein
MKQHFGMFASVSKQYLEGTERDSNSARRALPGNPYLCSVREPTPSKNRLSMNPAMRLWTAPDTDPTRALKHCG